MKKPSLLITLLLSASIGLSQSIPIPKLDSKSNFNGLQVHLAAAQLCKDFYTTNDLGETRNKKSSYRGHEKYSKYTCDVCTESIKAPLMSPLESFVERFLKDKRISKNRSNVFALRKIREELKTTYEVAYNKMVDSIDPENLISYQHGLITGYSFETGLMGFKMFTPKFHLAHPNRSDLVKTPYLVGNDIKDETIYGNSLIIFPIPIPENEAEKIYANYANHYHPNPPFAVCMKLHYALRLSEKFEGEARYYDVVYKKVEFFLPSPENIKQTSQYKIIQDNFAAKNKIAEVIFEDKIYHTKHYQSYQKYLAEN